MIHIHLKRRLDYNFLYCEKLDRDSRFDNEKLDRDFDEPKEILKIKF